MNPRITCGLCDHFAPRVSDVNDVRDGECRADFPMPDKWSGFLRHYPKVVADNPACGHFTMKGAAR